MDGGHLRAEHRLDLIARLDPLDHASMKLIPPSSGFWPCDPALASCLRSPARKSPSVEPMAFSNADLAECGIRVIDRDDARRDVQARALA